MLHLSRSPRLVFAAALAAPLALAAGALADATPAPAPAAVEAAASITEARARAHVDFLASDLLAGRATPSHGLDVAAAYISSHFARVGLEPGGANGGWFQGFPVLKEVQLSASALSIEGAGGTAARAFQQDKDFTPFPFTGSGSAAGALVFAGYGITAPNEEYDDYAGVDARGKVVLVLRHEPREREDGEAFSGRRTTRHSYFTTKVRNAVGHGAAALLVVDDPLNHDEPERLEGRWPATGGESGAYGDLPVIQLSRATAEALLGGRDLKKLQSEIDGALEPKSFEVEGARVSVAAEVKRVMGEGKNVIGILRGSDPEAKAEHLVFGAHYDHVGERDAHGGAGFPGQIGEAGKDGDLIHNGADDNASGTAALLETARAFAESGLRPRRTVVFVAFAGEELGLVGSQHYVKSPVGGPLEKTVAMINLDMVGRNANGQIYLGGNLSPALERAIEGANAKVGFKTSRMREEGPGGGTSDHWSFQRAGVPAAFFFSGFHDDYHRVSDHADKIVAAKVAGVARLTFFAALAVADDPGAVRPPPVARTKEVPPAAEGGGGGRKGGWF